MFPLPQITRLGDRIEKLSALQRKLGIKRILSTVSEAYGRMMLYEGLFQVKVLGAFKFILSSAHMLMWEQSFVWPACFQD